MGVAAAYFEHCVGNCESGSNLPSGIKELQVLSNPKREIYANILVKSHDDVYSCCQKSAGLHIPKRIP
jgi:hypothetical protein